MTASVTNDFRNHLLTLFKADVDSDGIPYHIGIARSAPVTSNDGITQENSGSIYNQERVRHTLQSVKVLSNNSFVIPTVTWVNGQEYEAYDNLNPFQTNFYVINSNREVFLCIEQGKLDDGTVQGAFAEPSASLANNLARTFRTSDGYLWRYLYKISNLAYSNYRTGQYTPVKQVTNRNTTIPEEILQLSLQDSAIGGEILGVMIDSGGRNYTSPTISFTGNGSGARFVADVFDNRIVNVRCDSNGFGSYLHGANYDFAKVEVTDPGGGSGASLRAIIAPREGIGADPVQALKSRELMIQTDFVGNEDGNIVAFSTDFHQIAIFKNLRLFGGESDGGKAPLFFGNTAQAAKIFTVSGVTGAWNENDTFQNATLTAQAKILYLDTTTLYYYQDQETGFGEFSIGDALTNAAGGQTSILAKVNPDIDAYSGEILYINTLEDAVTRETNQTEDIRIVIQLG